MKYIIACIFQDGNSRKSMSVFNQTLSTVLKPVINVNLPSGECMPEGCVLLCVDILTCEGFTLHQSATCVCQIMTTTSSNDKLNLLIGQHFQLDYKQSLP